MGDPRDIVESGVPGSALFARYTPWVVCTLFLTESLHPHEAKEVFAYQFSPWGLVGVDVILALHLQSEFDPRK
jgi:hypothetical protein